MRYFTLALFALLFAACSSEPQSNTVADTSAKDTIPSKSTIAEDLKPSTDIKQFLWLYSAFVQAASGKDDSLFNHFIHPDHGLWIISSDGAMPTMKNIHQLGELKVKDSFWPIKRESLVCTPLDEALPEVNCDSKNFWNKSGCFTQLQNTFKTQKIWEYAGLTDADVKRVTASAETISRTLINTENYRYYFSLIDGVWYLTFIDLRKPCNA